MFSLSCLLFSLTAQAARSPLQGVWRGTIGDQPVMVCLDTVNDLSSYYYPRYPKGLALQTPATAGGVWLEKSQGKVSGEWRLQSPDAGHLTGVWTAARSKRSAAISLSLIGAQRDASPCESEAFNGPRLDAARPVGGKVQLYGRKHYQVISMLDGEVSGLQILEPGAPVAAINRHLRQALRSEGVGYFSCHTAVTAESRDFAEYTIRAEPVFWSERWLTLAWSSSSSCGGAHPNSDLAFQNWDLKTGAPADLWRWFKSPEVTPALNRVIMAHAHPGPECSEVIANNGSYRLRPAANGMVFYPSLPHVAQACAEEILVPFRKLQPFLNASGRAEVEALQATGH